MEILAGRNAIREALIAGRRRFESVTLAERTGEQGIIAEILGLCRAARVPVNRAPRHELDRLGDELTHQGIVARPGTALTVAHVNLAQLTDERVQP